MSAMVDGRITKALSGFYYVQTADGLLECKARGRFRLDGTSPLVGDRVRCSLDANGKGRVDEILPRRNWFIRPAVANIDTLAFVAAGANPVTDPFLIDRVSVIAAESDCELIVCVNKSDLDPGDSLYETFHAAGFPTLRTCAVTGEGIHELLALLRGKTCAFTGNSGVGKSSLLNAMLPSAQIETGEVSDKLGRGRHTTRHVELYALGGGTTQSGLHGLSYCEQRTGNPICGGSEFGWLVGGRRPNKAGDSQIELRWLGENCE